jgi:hypothetical protein
MNKGAVARACACIGLMLVAVLRPVPALAQYSYYTSSSFYFNMNNYPDVTAATYRARGSTSPSRSRSGPATPTRSNTAFTTVSPLPYTRTTAVSARVRDQFLANMPIRGKERELARMRAMITENDFVQIYAGIVRLEGLESGSIEGLMALCYGQSWAIVNRQPLPTARQYQGIQRQLREDRTSRLVIEWDKRNNADRQELIEMLVYPLILQRSHYRIYLRDGNLAAIAEMSDRVQRGMTGFGMDMRALQLGNTGLQPR